MRGESQVEIAFLILLTAAYYSEYDANSDLIGEAAGCSPVIVRRIYKKLKDAELLDTAPGRYGLHLRREPKDVTYLDVIEAIKPLSPESVFGVASPLSGTTPVSSELYSALENDLSSAIDSVKDALRSKSLEDLACEIHVYSDTPKEEKNRLIREYMNEAEKRHEKR